MNDKEFKKPKCKIGDIVCVLISYHNQMPTLPKEGNLFQVEINEAYLENDIWKYKVYTSFLETTLTVTEDKIYII